MALQLKNLNNVFSRSAIVSFLTHLESLTSTKEIANALLKKINLLIGSNFSSFVQKNEDSINAISQMGSDEIVKNVFTKEMCEQIYKWVVIKNQITFLKLENQGQFIFVPLVDISSINKLEHGILVFHILNNDFLLTEEQNTLINIICKFAVLTMTKNIKSESIFKYELLEEQINKELKLTAKIQNLFSEYKNNNKILYGVIEDKNTAFNGSIWWIHQLNNENILVFIAEMEITKGYVLKNLKIPFAMLGGYLIGELCGLKIKPETLLKPSQVLTYLNQKTNPFFKELGIVANAWYAVIDTTKKGIKFSNANHVDPFLIGPEQQVSTLFMDASRKGNSLGINVDTSYLDISSYMSGGSKLIICTKAFLDEVNMAGNKYDESWFPQLLETMGSLSLIDITKGLQNILSENKNGTASKAPRLALLLEIPA